MKKFLCLAALISSTSFYGYTSETNSSNIDQPSQREEICILDDPYVKFNRKIFKFNSVLDHYAVKPLAVTYRNLFNGYTRNKIGNFLDNAVVPATTVNSVLQLDAKNTILSFWQFLINSTLGIGGIFDVASKFNLKSEPKNLGSTLAKYGVGPGPYLVLPLIGSSSARDITNTLFGDAYFNPLYYYSDGGVLVGYNVVRIIHNRESLLDFTNFVETNSLDPYITIKNAWHQHREANLVYPKGYRCYSLTKNLKN